ncbi:MAG: anion permease [Kiritimatiellae bacterium]|nr:anion permease [Kiritimatiellia bacterium]
MHAEEGQVVLGSAALARRLALLVGISAGAGLLGRWAGLELHQCIAGSVFLATILGTLLFWHLRLSIAFLGVSVLILTRSFDIPTFVESTSLPVILFLAGMMIVVGALRDLGFFTWVVQAIISMPGMTGRRFIAVTAVASALLACLVDEVTSMIFISVLIFQVCDRLKLNPAPYLIICVLCTNVGSAGTMMGNPVGIYIGTQAGLTFTDFMVWAFPIMLLALAATVVVTLLWYRADLREFDRRLAERMERNLSLAPRLEVPYKRSLALLIGTFTLIALHHQIEHVLKLDKNSVLLIAPLICAGITMIARPARARHYVEREIDWWTLMFFMLLFAVAGTLEHVGLTARMADAFTARFGHEPAGLIPVILATTAVGSAFVDNVVFVAAFSPVIRGLSESMFAMPLWWALLFGACFGGNITMIGSTANIVALGLLEKHSHVRIRFLQWLKVGFVSALVACLVAWGLLRVLSPAMERYAARRAAAAARP